jgi:hypothetical protein
MDQFSGAGHFRGGDPPQHILVNGFESKHCDEGAGSAPDKEVVMDWITSVTQ